MHVTSAIHCVEKQIVVGRVEFVGVSILLVLFRLGDHFVDVGTGEGS